MTTTENSATVKIIANMTREYNELDRTYKQLGVKHLTLFEVHTKTLKELSDLESRHHDLRVSETIHAQRFVDLKIAYGNLKGENRELRKILMAGDKIE